MLAEMAGSLRLVWQKHKKSSRLKMFNPDKSDKDPE